MMLIEEGKIGINKKAKETKDRKKYRRQEYEIRRELLSRKR